MDQVPCRSSRHRVAFLTFFLGAAHCNSNPPPPETPPGAHSETVQTPPAVTLPSANPMPEDTAPKAANSGSTEPSASPDALTRLAKDSNAFGFDLYQRMRTANAKGGNVVVSSASITTSLTMAWGGAKGETADQMRSVLHLEGTPSEVMQASGKIASSLQDASLPIKFRIANRLFGEKTYKFEPTFLDATKAAYGAPLEAMDFIKGAESSRVRINGWVEEQTEKRIKDLIPSGQLDRDTRMVLVNAIYFLGDWQTPFDKEKTRPQPFSLTATSKKDVPTMHREDRLRFTEGNGLKAVEIGYKGGTMSMLFVLPDKVDGVDALEKSFDNAKLDGLVASLKSQTVNVTLPKFEINPSESLSLGDRLKQMGMTLAFNPVKADFTGIANPPRPEDRLYISKVFHKAFVRVDEKGTEAAAASATVMMRATAMPMQQKIAEFHADHPFLFFIRDNVTGMILFNGRVSDPSVK